MMPLPADPNVQASPLIQLVLCFDSKSQWDPITGGTTKFSYLPIWYAHYDNNPSYSDWNNFGGWTKPAIKQYAGTTSLCGGSVDKNFY